MVPVLGIYKFLLLVLEIGILKLAEIGNFLFLACRSSNGEYDK
jgi:hypothetical protein